MRHGESLPLAATPGLMHRCGVLLLSIGRPFSYQESREGESQRGSLSLSLAPPITLRRASKLTPAAVSRPRNRPSAAAAVSPRYVPSFSWCASPAGWQAPRGKLKPRALVGGPCIPSSFVVCSVETRSLAHSRQQSEEQPLRCCHCRTASTGSVF